MFAFFNKKLVSKISFNLFKDINRFFIDEGDSDIMPKIESGKRDDSANDSKDLFEDELEEALCVFKTGGANSDILKENDA